jgi:hypothetical protein
MVAPARASARAPLQALHILQQPFQLGGGEIGIQQQARLATDALLECRTAGRAAAVLPDDGIVQWRAGLAVPDQRRLALVGDAEAGNVARLHAFQHGAAAGQRRLPDFTRIVLDPAIGGIDLPQRDDVAGQRPGRAVEQDGACRCGALVHRQQKGLVRPMHYRHATKAQDLSDQGKRLNPLLTVGLIKNPRNRLLKAALLQKAWGFLWGLPHTT